MLSRIDASLCCHLLLHLEDNQVQSEEQDHQESLDQDLVADTPLQVE